MSSPDNEAVLTALNAAFAVSENQWWMFGGEHPGDELAKRAPDVVVELVEMVRTYDKIPPEALWGQARGRLRAFASDFDGAPWSHLPPAVRHAFKAFQAALQHVDEDLAEAARVVAFQEALKKPQPPHDVEGTALEQIFGPLDATPW